MVVQQIKKFILNLLVIGIILIIPYNDYKTILEILLW